MEISGKTKTCCLIGDPVEHSLSPAMQNAAFKRLNLNFVYVAFRVKADELRNAMRGIRSLGIHGLNVTMPHKSAAMKYLDYVDPTAKSIGSVNTVLNEDGRLMGYNTDGIGALRALRENGVEPHGKKALLIGAGGAGKALAFQLAQEVDELKIVNRTGRKAKNLAKILRRKFDKRITGEAFSVECLERELSDADVLVNATSVGMHPDVKTSLIDPKWLRPDLSVMDIIYNPPETKLVKDAKSVGAKAFGGIDMLVHQGAASFETWTNHPAPVEVMKQTVLNEFSKPGVSVER